MKGQNLAGYSNHRAELDFYPTPPYITEALMQKEKFAGEIWECASGHGDMSKVLAKYNSVISSDIRPDGYGLKGTDFLMSSNHTDNIVTNPPFDKALEFVERAKMLADKKIAFLLKLVFLESAKRLPMFLDTEFPLARVYVFSKRVNFWGGTVESKGGGTIAFAWFVWDKEHKGKPIIDWI